MRRRQLHITILALILTASGSVAAFAEGPDGEAFDEQVAAMEERDAGLDELGVTLSCGVSGATLLPSTGGCFVQRRILTAANLEVSLALDAQASFSEERHGYLGGYVTVDYYGRDWGAFVEILSPSVLPPVGSGDRWRIGFTRRY